MSDDLIARLEELVTRLLSERGELTRCNRQLQVERDSLLTERGRVHAELGELLVKIDRLEKTDP